MTRSRVVIRCPSCGRRTMSRVRRTVRTRVGRTELGIPGVEIEECSACGERLYDLAALARIRDARQEALRSGAA